MFEEIFYHPPRSLDLHLDIQILSQYSARWRSTFVPLNMISTAQKLKRFSSLSHVIMIDFYVVGGHSVRLILF